MVTHKQRNEKLWTNDKCLVGKFDGNWNQDVTEIDP